MGHQPRAHVLLLDAVRAASRRRVRACDVAVEMAVVGGDPEQQFVRHERPGERAAGGVVGVTAHARFDQALQIVRGRPRGDVDGAADGVAPIHGALRALQYLDALDVEEGLGDLVGVRELDAVDHHGHRRLTVVRLTDPAHVELRHAGLLRLHDGDVRNAQAEVLDAGDVRGLDGGRTERRHGVRHFQQPLFAPARRHEHFARACGGRGEVPGFLSASRAGRGEHEATVPVRSAVSAANGASTVLPESRRPDACPIHTTDPCRRTSSAQRSPEGREAPYRREACLGLVRLLARLLIFHREGAHFRGSMRTADRSFTHCRATDCRPR